MTSPEPGQAGEEPAAPPSGAPRRSGGVRRVVRQVFLWAVVLAVAWVLWRHREDAATALRSVEPGLVLLSLVLGVVGAGLPAVVWRDLLTAQGHRTAPAAAARAFFLAQLGKYVPGGIWSLVAQVDLARDLRVPARPAAVATLVTIALSILSALLVAVLTVPFALPDLAMDLWWAFALVPVLLVLLHPRVVEWWSSAVFRLVRRPAPALRLGWGFLGRSVLVLVVSWMCLGLQFGALVQGQVADGTTTWLLSCGAFALAWVAGFLVLVAPAGAGVREGALVLAFAGSLPGSAVLTLALLSRLVLTLADVLLALGAWGIVRARRSGSGGSEGLERST